MLTIVVAVLAIAMLILVLGVIIRFSIVSAWRTRSADDRLTLPDSEGVERVCGFAPPADLIRLYRDGSLTRLVEFSLIDKTQQPNETWFFGGFYPLTRQDASAQRQIHRISSGIPIADDGDKGVYFVTRDGRIMFRPAGRNAREAQVAPSAKALSRFEVALDERE